MCKYYKFSLRIKNAKGVYKIVIFDRHKGGAI